MLFFFFLGHVIFLSIFNRGKYFDFFYVTPPCYIVRRSMEWVSSSSPLQHDCLGSLCMCAHSCIVILIPVLNRQSHPSFWPLSWPPLCALALHRSVPDPSVAEPSSPLLSNVVGLCNCQFAHYNILIISLLWCAPVPFVDSSLFVEFPSVWPLASAACCNLVLLASLFRTGQLKIIVGTFFV